MRGQSDPELKKYSWVVIRTQKDRKLQTLTEVCTDFASLRPSVNIHTLAEQTFAVEENDGSEEMFAMMDRSQWTGQGVSEMTIPPSLAQMFALARRMGYEMRPIARRADQPPGSPRTPFASGQGYCPPFLQGRDFLLRSDGTYAGSLPKAGFNTTVQATGLEHAVRWTTTEEH